MPGTVRVFSRDPVRTELPAHSQVLLDPLVDFHFAVENFGQVAAAVIQIILLGNDPHAHHIACQRDVPEPSLVRDVGDGGGAFVDPWVAHGSSTVSPDSDLRSE